jgi:hypothetical protein
MQIFPVGTELTDRHDKANGHFSQFCACALRHSPYSKKRYTNYHCALKQISVDWMLSLKQMMDVL